MKFSRADFSTADAALSREWLVTNGLGGFASGTVAQANTRRYHGLLVSALSPPVDRVVMVSKLDASATYRGKRFELATNEYASSTLAPRGEAPEYNTVDATLWYFHAIDAYAEATGDSRLLRDVYPTLREIVDWHRRGTRYGIHVDPEDGLLHAGEPGVQLTWMDAKIGDWVVTPRTGKPVEINALWHFALSRMARWASALSDHANAARYAQDAARVSATFSDAFWNAEGRYLFDAIDCPAEHLITEARNSRGQRADASLRPNQIFAVSLSDDLLPADRARDVVSTCARHLLTPVGLRSLSPTDPRYVAR